MTAIVKKHKLLPFLKTVLPLNPTIVEAGAFKGYDTTAFAQNWPAGTIHAFEPVPELFTALQERTRIFTNVYCYAYALSNTNEVKTLHVADKAGVTTQASSLHEPHDRLTISPITFTQSISVQTKTLMQWMQQQTVSHIDLLWLDLQGHEHTVLAAATDILHKIDFIHTEVYFVQGYKDHPLCDELISWLQQHNFIPIAQDFEDRSKSFFGNIIFRRLQ